jgi:hypothetical protein
LISTDPNENAGLENAKVAIKLKDFGTVYRGNENGKFDVYEMTDIQINGLRKFLGYTFVEEAMRALPSWLDIRCSSTIADKAQAYVGEGDDISYPVFGNGMSMMVMLTGDDKTTHTYLAGEINSPSGKVLIARCTFENTSESTQTFFPLEINVDGNDGTLVAVGAGVDYPFAKDAPTWERLRKASSSAWSLRKGTPDTLIYVFGVAADTPTRKLKLMYQGSQIAQTP